MALKHVSITVASLLGTLWLQLFFAFQVGEFLVRDRRLIFAEPGLETGQRKFMTSNFGSVISSIA
jgi:hypothetical protein